MASIDVWSDFESLRHNVKHNTVDRLKQILSHFNEECGTNCTKSGKKQDLIDRVTRELDNWRRTNATDKWSRARTILSQIRTNGMYTPTRTNDLYSSPPSANGTYSAAGPSYQQPATISRYDPYAAPRLPAVMPTKASAPAPSTSSTPSIRFKPSPFFRVERMISSVIECPESTSQMDRRQQSFNFTLPADVVQKLQSTSPKYQLRLYCTSSTYYTPTPAFRSNLLCPIEFPPTCEVRVNSVQLTANLKGMKKKPGTAPPPDLGKSVRMNANSQNRVEMIYVNSQQPVTPKKYYLVVMLVEVTTVEQLIDRLKKGKQKSTAEVLAKMNQPLSDEDDIIAGHQKMSLKCPLSYMRIATPCRAWSCVHPQCFDAYSWFSVMEQTTTWMCPVCEKTLNVDDLIVDGYFDSIVNSTPEEVEDVIVEPDGEWHSEDNAYGSEKWKAARIAAGLPLGPSVKERSPTPVKPNIADLDKKGSMQSNTEILIIDSDDEDDEGRVKRELSPSYTRGGAQKTGALGANGSRHSASSGPARSSTAATIEADVIDLTLDSDEEAAQPPAPSRKRRAEDTESLSPTEAIWKKSRVDGATSSPAARSTTFASDPSSFGVPRQSHPPAPIPAPAPSSSSSSAAPAAPRYDTFSANSAAYQLPHSLPARPGAGPALPPINGAGYSSGYSRTNGVSSASSSAWQRR